MTEKTTAQKAMEKIITGEVKQRSRWYFVMKNALLWFFGFVSVSAGAVIVSVIIYTLANSDMDLNHAIYGYMISRTTFIWIVIWIVVTAIFMLLCDVSVRHTKRGYIYPLRTIFIVDIAVSIIFGTALYFSGIGCYIDTIVGSHIHQYNTVDKRRAMAFNKPEQGILMGRVVATHDDHVEVAVNGEVWMVFTRAIPPNKMVFMAEGDRLVFAGKKYARNTFVACDVKKRSARGVYQNMRDKHMEALMYMQEHIREEMLSQLRPQPSDVLCDDSVRWRVEIQTKK